MSYDLIYTRRAARDIARLNHETQLRIKGKLEQYRLAPFQHAEKLVTSELGSSSMLQIPILLFCASATAVRFTAKYSPFTHANPPGQRCF